MTTATIMDVMQALDCGRYIADRKLAGIPYTLQGVNNRKRKVYTLHDLPDDLRASVEHYLATGRQQPREVHLLDLPTAGPADLDAAIKTALKRAITKSQKSRERIAGEMSQLVGRKVTKAMLDAYTAANRTSYRFPLALALAFEIATDSYCLTRLLSKRRGCSLLVGEDIAFVELARIERDKIELERKAQAVKTGLINKKE